MEDYIQFFDLSILYPFLLLLGRIFAFMVFIPIFSHKSIPVKIKVVFSFYLAIFLFPIVPHTMTFTDNQFILALISEITLGFAAGVILNIIFASIKIAGELVSYASALSMAQQFDPATGAQSTLVSRFFDYIILIFFFTTGMHEVMLIALAKSFESIQLGGFILNDYKGVDMIIKEMGKMMLFAFSISLPVFFVSMTMDLFFGYATRSMPQFSVFVVTFQFKFMLIFFILTYITAILVEKFKDYFLDTMFINNF
jgi:flagellar biosynthesis protein FliR